MKKTYLLIVLSLTFGFAHGQNNKNAAGQHIPMKEYNFNNSLSSETIKPTTSGNAGNTKAFDIIWDEYFTDADGTVAPFSTSNGTYTVDGANSNYWTQSAATTDPFGNNPANMDGNHLRWDSYGPNSDEADFASTPVNGAIRTPVIDLSTATNNNLKLNFQTSSIYCCHPQEFPWTVSVSTDGGLTFGAPFNLDFEIGRNEYSESPLDYTIDLNGVLDPTPANNNLVVIEFRWVGDNQFDYADGGFQFNTHYWWLLDDLIIYETPDYDLKMANAWTGDIINDYEFSETTPALGGTFVAQARIINNGSQIPTNVELQVDILDDLGNTVQTATGGTLSNGLTLTEDTITFDTGIDLSAFTVGKYTAQYEITLAEADADLTDNVRTRTFSITDNTYATYNADLDLSGESPGYSYTATPSAIAQFGNVYVFEEDVILHGVELAGHPGYNNIPTDIGSTIEVFIEEFDNATFESNYVAGPFAYTVTEDKISNDGTSRYLYNLHQSEEGESGEIVLQANTLYVISFNHPGNTESHFWYWGTPKDDDFSARTYGPFGAGGNTGWFTFPWEPAMALNYDETLDLGSEELLDRSLRLYPNPANENTTISYSLKNSTAVSIEIHDLAGNLVYNVDKGAQAAGNHELNVNVSDLSNGMYTYTLSTDNTKVTKKFVINK